MPHQEEEGVEQDIADLLSEFSDALRHAGSVPPFEPFLRRCPAGERREFTSLMNTLVLTHKALSTVAAAPTARSRRTAAEPAAAESALAGADR